MPNKRSEQGFVDYIIEVLYMWYMEDFTIDKLIISNSPTGEVSISLRGWKDA